jgi:hypothetical protein
MGRTRLLCPSRRLIVRLEPAALPVSSSSLIRPTVKIIEQLRQIERVAERRMVAVHKIVFPEDGASPAEAADR